MSRTATVITPATSANLGPGFDSFGIALALHDRFTAALADEWSVEVVGEGAGHLPTDASNRVACSMARLFAEVGEEGRAASVRCENRIPQGAGLGSSAAAVVGGLLLGNELLDAGLDRAALLRLAAKIEGHPDNVAAALHGGFTVSWHDGDASRCLRLEPARGLAAVVVTADAPLPTGASRALLPDSVPHADAAFSAGRAGLLVAGIALGDTEALSAGLADRIHEPYRIHAVADLERVRSALVDAGACGAVLSGAGPTVIGLVAAEDDDRAVERARAVASAARETVLQLAGRGEPHAFAVARDGAALV